VISVPDERLLSTAAVAKALGVTGKTVLRYEQRGWLRPAQVLPSGHRRWRLSEVRAQLAKLRERDE
jgi:DNA-binding transcriptional MerR regulator